jgi:hypothetical protein
MELAEMGIFEAIAKPKAARQTSPIRSLNLWRSTFQGNGPDVVSHGSDLGTATAVFNG